MIVIRTKNSLYGIKACGDHFEVCKLQKRSGGDYLLVGEVRKTEVISLRVGDSAWFGDWRTSGVEAIYEDEIHG